MPEHVVEHGARFRLAHHIAARVGAKYGYWCMKLRLRSSRRPVFVVEAVRSLSSLGMSAQPPDSPFAGSARFISRASSG